MTIKLSKLEPETMLVSENRVLSVEELINGMSKGYVTQNVWYVADHNIWRPDVKEMLLNYAEREADNLYEDAGDQIEDELLPHVEAIQEILRDVELPYYRWGEEVEIDIEQDGE